MEENLVLKYGFIGGGNMAKAIYEGMIKTELVKPSQTYVSARSEKTINNWKAIGVNSYQDNKIVVQEADVIFLSVKPNVIESVINDMMINYKSPDNTKNKLFLSVITGISLDHLQKLFVGFEGARIIRVMPNTPVMVGEGCTVFAPAGTATKSDAGIVEKIFSSCGSCVQIPEYLFSAAGAVASSGPAFMYLVIEALSDGAVKMGLPREMATTFAAQMALGAAKMVLNTGKHPGQLKDEVCSPGGTTICGVHVLERHGLRNSLLSAVEATALKNLEMGNSKNDK